MISLYIQDKCYNPSDFRGWRCSIMVECLLRGREGRRRREGEKED
jgi:hypothetical protein